MKVVVPRFQMEGHERPYHHMTSTHLKDHELDNGAKRILE